MTVQKFNLVTTGMIKVTVKYSKTVKQTSEDRKYFSSYGTDIRRNPLQDVAGSAGADPGFDEAGFG